MTAHGVERFEHATGESVAYRYRAGRQPAVVFLGGFRSDMSGVKATYLERWCVERGQAYLRLDYRGHGQSDGRFETLGISHWLTDVRGVLDALGIQRPLVVGSSMGGWLALLLARDGSRPLHGVLTLAGAPDFTQCLLWPKLKASQQRDIMQNGVTLMPSRYGDGPYPISRVLIEDGRQHQVLNQPLTLNCPLRILHGTADPDVPYEHGVRLFEHVRAPGTTLMLLKDGDHRLSAPVALSEITLAIAALLADAGSPTEDESP